jgi:hypothetical protein
MSLLLKNTYPIFGEPLNAIVPLNNDDEYIVMRLFSTTLVEDARKWYNSLPDKVSKLGMISIKLS